MIILGYALSFLIEKLSCGYSIKLTCCKYTLIAHKNGVMKKQGKVSVVIYPNIPSKYTPYLHHCFTHKPLHSSILAD